MGFITGVRAQIAGQRALRTHIAANKLAGEDKPDEAGAKFEEARVLYEKALGEGVPSPNVCLGFSVLLLRLGAFERAHDVMQSMRNLKGMTEDDWCELRINYSICLWRLGRLDEAIETIRRAAEYKMTTSIYTSLGMYLVEKARMTGDFAEVEAFNRRAMDYDDADGGILDNMGCMYEAMADRARRNGDEASAEQLRRRAIEYYEKAHAVGPRQIATIYNLARLSHEDGDDIRARQLLAQTDVLSFSAICPVSQEMVETLRAKLK